MTGASSAACLVDIVVLSWNSASTLEECLRSCFGQSVQCGVVLVDNGSSDGSLEIARQFPSLRVIALPTNTGYAVGMNTGVAATTSTLGVIPLNADALLSTNYVECAVNVLRSRPSAGMFGGMVRQVDDLSHALSEGANDDGSFLTISAGMRVGWSTPPLAATQVAKVNGAAPIIRHKAWRDVSSEGTEGPFDTTYVTYGEDIDLSLRMLRRGWSIWFEPSLRSAHLRSGSSARAFAGKPAQLQSLQVRNCFRNAVRHAPAGWLIGCCLTVVLGGFAMSARGLLRMQPASKIWAPLGGLVGAIAFLPADLRVRRSAGPCSQRRWIVARTKRTRRVQPRPA
jgi:GT2 family glycosyltransferase